MIELVFAKNLEVTLIKGESFNLNYSRSYFG